jgi:hypothetical protein
MSATGGVGMSTAEELRIALEDLCDREELRDRDDTPFWVLSAAITELVALRQDAAARAARAPEEDDYPIAVFRDLWRVLGELRAATGEDGRA